MNENYSKQGYLLEDYRLFHLGGYAGAKTEYHYHEFCKLLLLVSGSGGYWIQGQRYTLQPGDIVLVGSHCIHKPEFEPGSPYERIIIYISPEYLRRLSTDDSDLTMCFSGRPGHVLRCEKSRYLFRLAAELEEELSGDAFGRRIIGNSLLLQLLVEITRELCRNENPQPKPSQVKDTRVLGIMGYIDEHLTEDLSVEQLAEEFFWSKYHMMRRFRAETGSSIYQYITQRRLMLARDLINQGLSATESCFRSGFGSYSSFTRTYGKFFGTTPTGRKYAASLADEVFE